MEIEGLDLIEIEFHMFDRESEIFREVIRLVLIAGDERDGLHGEIE